MDEFKEDKKKLEEAIEYHIKKFVKKYHVKIEYINLKEFGYYNGDIDYKIEIDVKL